MDLTSAKHDIPDDDINTFHKKIQEKIQEEIQKIIGSPTVIRPAMELSHLPPFKPDDTNLEKLEWIFPPIPVELEDYIPEVNLEDLEGFADECRKEICNDTCNQKE